MQEYDDYLFSTYHFRINDLKKKPLKAYQIDVLRKLNPTEFDLTSWREEGTFQNWLEWFSKIRKTPKDGQLNIFPSSPNS